MKADLKPGKVPTQGNPVTALAGDREGASEALLCLLLGSGRREMQTEIKSHLFNFPL